MEKKKIVLAGIVVGLMSAVLVKMGNPGNMGVCIACFLRDITGALGFHRAEVVQYIRPEIIGIVLGAFGSAVAFKEFSSKGGSSPVTRFLLGAMVMVGALVFLGCPLRMMLRIAGGDLNAWVGLAGFTVGIVCGIFFLNKGFTLKRNYSLGKVEGKLFTAFIILLGVALLAKPAFIFFSAKGPGSLHAPIAIALGAGLVTGILAQRTRLCMVGGIRDMILFKDNYLLLGFIAIIISAGVANVAFGQFKLGFVEQPIAHADGLWNFMGMLLAGWGSVLLGGCPLRQLILAGEGNADSAITIAGLMTGAAVAHNFALAASPKGVPANGKAAVVALLVIIAVISVMNSQLVASAEKTKLSSKEA